MFLLSHELRVLKSPIMDESFYCNCSTQTIYDGQLNVRLMQHGTAPIGAVSPNLPVIFSSRGCDTRSPFAGHFNDACSISAACMINLLVTVTILVSVVFLAVAKRHGAIAGIFSAAFVGLSPTVLSHLSLATPDRWFFILGSIVVGVLVRCRTPCFENGIALATVLAFAGSTKYTGLILVVVVCICFSRDLYKKRFRCSLAV